MGVIAAGTIYNYSFPGLAWLLGAALIWMLVDRLAGARPREVPHCEPPAAASGSAEPGRRPGGRDRDPGGRGAARDLPAGELLELQGLQPVRAPARRSASATSASPSTRWRRSGSGPRASSGSPRRTRPRPRSPSTSAALLALAAFAWGLGRALSRRESALPSALLAGDAPLPRLARSGHALHAGEGARDRRPADHADRPARAARGRLAAGRGGRRPGGGRGELVAAAAAPAADRLRGPPAHARLRGGRRLLDPAAAAAVGGRARLPPAGDAADAADRRRPERALPRPRQLRLLGADRLGGLRADHQPLRRRGDPLALPGHRPERQVRLGQRAAVRHEQVQLGGHDERGDAEPGAARLHAAPADRRLRPLAPRPPGRAAAHSVSSRSTPAPRSTATTPARRR